MEKLIQLFGHSIRFVYHSFDRIVINGYLSTLSRPENLIYFFRNVKKVECISKEALRQRTDQYLGWVNAIIPFTPSLNVPVISVWLGSPPSVLRISSDGELPNAQRVNSRWCLIRSIMPTISCVPTPGTPSLNSTKSISPSCVSKPAQTTSKTFARKNV